MAVFPQLVSRLGHENNVVAKALHTVVKIGSSVPTAVDVDHCGHYKHAKFAFPLGVPWARKLTEDVVSNPSGDLKRYKSLKEASLSRYGIKLTIVPYADRSGSPSHPTNR